MHNAKSADRGASGKLATIYPVDDAQLEVVLLSSVRFSRASRGRTF
jgi:hypothetical protein